MDYRDISYDDLEFEGGRIVKVRGARHNYMDGNELITLVSGLSALVYRAPAVLSVPQIEAFTSAAYSHRDDGLGVMVNLVAGGVRVLVTEVRAGRPKRSAGETLRWEALGGTNGSAEIAAHAAVRGAEGKLAGVGVA